MKHSWLVVSALFALIPSAWGKECQTPIAAFPAGDLVAVSDRIPLKNCGTKNAYYGIGEPVDYEKARKCAFLERQRDPDLLFGSNTVLMMLYANGYGVKKDLDLAIRIAGCDVPGSRAEHKRRIAHLNKLKQKSEAKPFDFCDDITGGMMQGLCSIHAAEVRESKLNSQ